MDSIFIGYDDRESEAFSVCRRTIRNHSGGRPITPLDLDELRRSGLYKRPTSMRKNSQGVMQLWDEVSEHWMSTQFAVSRFLTPIIAKEGYALFCDCDIIALGHLDELFDYCRSDPSKAVWCVQHDYMPDNDVKMDGQLQTLYRRKNWSSLTVWNCDHKAVKKLSLKTINTVPGRDLHAFNFLDDEEIGALHPKWNHLVGITKEDPEDPPVMIHYTNGGPWLGDYKDVPYAEHYFNARREWLAEDGYAHGRPETWAGYKTGAGDAAYLR